VNHDDERQLLEQAAAGDEDACRQLVRAHSSAVAAVVVSMLGRGDDADDVGQETFVRFFRSLARFRGDASARTYLTRIAMNLCIDALDRRKRQRRFVRLDDAREARQAAAPHDTAVDDRERRAAVLRALESLDAKHRAVVTLRFLDDRSTRETADLLGVPEGTVMSRLRRALAKLEDALRPVVHS
jgi:RNA polymerase sigma-70 factor (ECF subfamily)